MAREGKKRGSLMAGQVSHPGQRLRRGHSAEGHLAQQRVEKAPPPAPNLCHEDGAARTTVPPRPERVTQDDIDGLTGGFGHAAEYLERAGFDGTELYGAHTYLLSQFLNPATNRRGDVYGGSVGNPARLVLEVVQAVRRVPSGLSTGS
ncbi:hypothetical protein B0J12DRAFT_698105 [Macrophomina phaseolina]|uniref:NADH:flavin oxidoreductase/NADH oxidase N-terminal domain-containing protein n=1 Tax=Macrophomina phaseolina TaxID=35725 RepID=A0ABQ8GGH2_9PEZI|nr:hypothetical protein B0J12DRAFT_698105 [Macrophomina phaseolina]